MQDPQNTPTHTATQEMSRLSPARGNFVGQGIEQAGGLMEWLK